MIAVSLLSASSAVEPDSTELVFVQAAPDVEWDAVFSRTEGWSGGDVVGTVDLGDGRTVWMLGDSWIGNVAHGKHAAGSHMVNNAIGVQRHSSIPKPVYAVPGLDRGKAYFTYAAKGHLHLSRTNELLVTYIVNAHNFGDMVADATIYRPRFVRVPLSGFLPALAK